jgi:hypothetical protein
MLIQVKSKMLHDLKANLPLRGNVHRITSRTTIRGRRPCFLYRSGYRKSSPVRNACSEKVSFRKHIDHFEHSLPDTEWLEVVGKRGWFVLTRDEEIERNPLEVAALREANVGAFILVARRLNRYQITKAIQLALPDMIRATRQYTKPFIIRIYRDGRLQFKK